MIKTLCRPLVIAALLGSAALLFFGAGCAAQIGTVGLTGSYSDAAGDTYAGGVNVGLNYPSPSPSPSPKSPVIDHSK
jgi:hypothetical protein